MSKKNTKIALAALCVLGAACYLLQFVLGEDITHMNNFVPWGLYIVGFMCFTGLAAGALLLIGLAWLTDGLAELRPYTRILLICGVLCGLAGAGAFIFVDLGNPQRGIYMMLSPNPTSPQVWDAAVLSLYGLTGILLGRQAWLIAQGRRTAASMRPLALLAVIAGLLVIVTSFAFALMVAAPSWNEPGEPLSFLFAAAIIALAVLSLVLLHLSPLPACWESRRWSAAGHGSGRGTKTEQVSRKETFHNQRCAWPSLLGFEQEKQQGEDKA